MSCTIIPPYLLRALAQADDVQVAATASETLAVDARLRSARSARQSDAVGASLPRDDGSKPSRGVYDAKGRRTLPGVAVRLEGQPATSDVAAGEAYDGLGATWTMFKEVFGRDSLDGAGEPLIGTVHYAKGYDNAFWNGTQMVFGDGDGVIFNRFTAAVDVIGHELAHAVTERTAGLVYDGQPGALNEHLSDVFGSLVKQRLLGQTVDQADWLIGAGLLAPGVAGVAIRSMRAPGTAYDDPRLGKDPQPDSMAGYVVTTDDFGGVHINSGIPNRAFYLVASTIGGSAWGAPGLIWYDTIVGHIKPDCDFATFAGLTVAAASARFGQGSREADAVRAAWVSVGVLQAQSGSAGRSVPGPAGGSGSAGGTAGTLTVTRTGGFAGVQQAKTVELAELPASERMAWTKALRDRDLLDAPDVEPWPDAFCYGITCTAPLVDVQLPEHAMPERLHDLARKLLGDL